MVKEREEMSLYDYKQSIEIAAEDYPFYALIMAAMRQADSDNIVALKLAFPQVYYELNRRYHAPGGLLPGEAEPTKALDEYLDF